MPDARSPYQRYGKIPHRYSPLLSQLKAARDRGDHEEAERLAAQHSRAFGNVKRGRLADCIPLDED